MILLFIAFIDGPIFDKNGPEVVTKITPGYMEPLPYNKMNSIKQIVYNCLFPLIYTLSPTWQLHALNNMILNYLIGNLGAIVFHIIENKSHQIQFFMILHILSSSFFPKV